MEDLLSLILPILTIVLLIVLLVTMLLEARRRREDSEAIDDLIDRLEQAEEREEELLRGNALLRHSLETMDRMNAERSDSVRRELSSSQGELRTEILSGVRNGMDSTATILLESRRKADAAIEERLKTFDVTNEQKLENIRQTVEHRLTAIQGDTGKKLDEMRGIVEEKLEKTLEARMTDSFRLVNERLEQVYKGLGEMQTLANGVGDLKKVLSNVKTRGILGEVQLGAILQEILSPEQYETNVATVPGSQERVEFAVRIPGEAGETVYLPIDSKFPGDLYADLQDAYETGDREAVESAAAALAARIRQEAADIRSKYVSVPYTTEFAILFLPFEGLYAEAVNRSLLEEIQRKYHVNIAGPSTMAILLNSLQMGFRAFAIQKRSGEVWKVLGTVKTEFSKFSEVLAASRKHLQQADNDLDLLIGTRTRQILKSLRGVESIELGEPAEAEEAGDTQDHGM